MRCDAMRLRFFRCGCRCCIVAIAVGAAVGAAGGKFALSRNRSTCLPGGVVGRRFRSKPAGPVDLHTTPGSQAASTCIPTYQVSDVHDYYYDDDYDDYDHDYDYDCDDEDNDDDYRHRYVITELLQSDLHKIIVSPQHLSPDHIKVFLYQILRGLKYLHSARILHRDIKPGNLLVNSNCVLKICDFGLARVEEPDQNKHMTQEVVTQYYRAPEILMGARHYTAAVDVWSVGCIFGELLRRRILFQAQSPVQQLELITELLGTPTLEDMRYACEGARTHMLRRAPKPPSLTALYTLSSQATHEAVHLLCQMLVFDPDKRITVVDALAHPYLDEGRLRYHSCMCTCCYTTSAGMRQYTGDFEPATTHPFDDLWERKLTSVQQVKEEMHKFIAEQLNTSRVPLCINPQSAAFKSFAR
uniref:Serine/threonine kinase NLK n=1 Tax=Vespula pensylvanica TaxID=30213 RepID=A0A834KW51_VESPE|nr:hypothetical protein H0235_012933 [Vespula pensylvanica]